MEMLMSFLKKINIIFISCALGFILSSCTKISDTDNYSRTIGSVIDDEITELKLQREIDTNTALRENTHLDIVSYNGMLLIAGQATNQKAKNEISKLASKLPRVRKVFNQITVLPGDKKIVHATSPKDIWITTKIKAKMLAQEKISPRNIKVVTENGTVYLLGLVDIKDADKATNIASHVSGVDKVIKLFEYIG
tara:strand:+ start:21353 stop:21934 length:582 start_codon:yes stop_codon:yes gene_type:complete